MTEVVFHSVVKMGISKSQYPGTLKDTVCSKCGMNLNHLNRIEQDKHAEKCSKQETLI